MQDSAPAETSMAENVRAARVAAGLSQQALASKAGVAIRTVARIEGGEDVRVATLQELATALDVPLSKLTPSPEPAK